jgi:hypothetical protein
MAQSAPEQLHDLEQLSIITKTDPTGEELLTIHLDVDPIFGTAQCEAVFDKKTKRWKLTTSSNARLDDGSKDQWTPRSLAFPTATRETDAWTDSLPVSDYVRMFVHEIDWASTTLGPIETWPAVLQTCCHMIFSDSRPAVLYWGPDLIAIGNEMFSDRLTQRLRKSSAICGRPFRDIFPELVHDFTPMFNQINTTGRAVDRLNVNLFPTDTNGFIEETFWAGSFLPVRGEKGSVLGIYNRGVDTTRDVLRERWTTILNAISATPDNGLDSIWAHVFGVLATYSSDFPVAFAYSAQDKEDGRCLLQLQQSLGLPTQGHPLVPRVCDLYEGVGGFLPLLRKAESTGKIVVLHRSDGTLPEGFVQGFEWRGFKQPATSMCIVPIHASNRLLGLCVFYLNPRRPYDSDYEGFLHSLARTASSTIASYLDREDADRRDERLNRQLEESEKQIRNMAEYGPVGMLCVSFQIIPLAEPLIHMLMASQATCPQRSDRVGK